MAAVFYDADAVGAIDLAFDLDHLIIAFDAFKDHAAERSIVAIGAVGVNDRFIRMIFSPARHRIFSPNIGG